MPNTNEAAAKPKVGLTKMDAVKKAQSALGKKAKPLAIQKYVKEELNIDVSTAVISSYKKEIARKAKQLKKGARPKTKPSPVAASAPRQTAPGGPAGIPLKDILAVKELVGRLGAGPLHTLIDAFAR